ncbi:MAG: ABC transporter ATP-binding protein/permease [Lachnospiraceae bacterium]|nr:ABC transporter ATP-binding protein/permease [Lachnospiraceae bacterium]
MGKFIDFVKDRSNQRRYLQWLVKLTGKSKSKLFGLFILNTLVAASTVVISLINKEIVDKASDHARFQAMVILMVGLYAFSIIGGLVESLLESLITEKYACQVRSSLFEKLLGMSWKNRTKYHSEELLSRITSDVEQITTGVSQLVISVGGLLIRLVLAFVLLWGYGKILAIATIVIAPVGVLAFLFVSIGLKKVQKEYQQTEANYRVFLQERLSKIDLVQIFGQENSSIGKLNKIQDKRLALVRKKNWWKVLGSGIISLTFTGTHAVAFVLGAVMVNEGNITFGVMTAFLSLVGQIQGPIYSIANKLPQVVGVLASAGRIMEVSECEEDDDIIEDNAADLSDGFLGLAAENVCIGYGEELIVKNASFSIKPGEMVMLAGRSGIGKTTLLRSIMGFLPVSSGKLSFVDESGKCAACGNKTREHISYVPQGNTLMFGSIAENLLMGNSNATREEMMEALRVADALDFVMELPQGIDTVIGEKATGISEGQAQRISIARALLKKSGFLILDEATSALDENTEKKILEAISKSNHPTCLFVSHRRYLEKYADQVVELG